MCIWKKTEDRGVIDGTEAIRSDEEEQHEAAGGYRNEQMDKTTRRQVFGVGRADNSGKYGAVTGVPSLEPVFQYADPLLPILPD